MGARAHFEDPIYYADIYDWRDEDAVYYRSLARERGAVLEHGIGNGRVALPLARAGVSVTGLDWSRPMLDHLRARLTKEAPEVRRRVKLHQGDMRTARLHKRYPLIICPFNAALHLYTRRDVEQWLERVREHLEPGGELVFDISMPINEDLARDPAVPYRIPPFDHPTAGRVSYREHFDYDPVRQILFVSMYFDPAPKKAGVKRAVGADAKRAGTKPADPGPAATYEGPAPKQITEGFMTPLAHRQFHPQEMEALLHYNDFEIAAVYGDWKRGPLVPKSDVMVWHARPLTPARRRSAATAAHQRKASQP